MAVSTAINQSKAEDIKYSVYIFHKKQAHQKMSKWQKIKETKSIGTALRYAKALHRHRKYEKIEIQKKQYCHSEHKIIGKTVRVFEKSEHLWQGLLKNIITHAQNT